MVVEVWLSLVLRVASGILAIQTPAAPVKFERAFKYAVAAVAEGSRRDVDPFELIAIARDETDFREGTRGPDGKDCGLTQTRVTISRFTCRQLLRSYWLDFQEAARELSEYAAACRGKSDFDRCRLNHYNSGVHYARRGFHGNYWRRIGCFAGAARAGVPAGDACRGERGRRALAHAVAMRPST
jgi:hypothetical protein